MVVPYEMNPHSIWGVGVPENMSDSTAIMNGHARMAIDNLALAGSVILEISDEGLEDDTSYDIYPGKIFHRKTGYQGNAVNQIKLSATTQENLMMFDRFRQLADEQTGLPSYSHGQTGVSSTTRTASGMSMLMGAAALNIKTIVKNLDDYLLEPLGRSMFYWNMQFSPDPEIKGDLNVKAVGTDSVMQKEVRSQRLTQFLQIAANPALAPFIKLDKIVKEIAESLDLDPEEIINDPEAAKIYAGIIGAAGSLNMNTQQGVEPPTGGGELPQGQMGNGDGTIGTGAPPLPGEQGFSGNVQ
jgi:hypothetical protein